MPKVKRKSLTSSRRSDVGRLLEAAIAKLPKPQKAPPPPDFIEEDMDTRVEPTSFFINLGRGIVSVAGNFLSGGDGFGLSGGTTGDGDSSGFLEQVWSMGCLGSSYDNGGGGSIYMGGFPDDDIRYGQIH